MNVTTNPFTPPHPVTACVTVKSLVPLVTSTVAKIKDKFEI